VLNISTTLSCSASPDLLILGDEVTVTGSLSPTLIGKPIDLLYLKPDSSTLLITVLTDSSGNYTHTFVPNMFGNWSITATWLGEAKYDAAFNTSAAFTVHVLPEASFTYSPSTDVSIFTLISFSDTSTDLDGTILSWLWDFGDETTSSDQNPIHMYTDADDYNITLTVTENDGYTNMTSHLITIHETTIIPTSINCSVSLFAVPVGGSPTIPSGVPPGSVITVSGAISLPISNTTVTLTYTKPDGSTFTRTVTTTLGAYNDTVTPDMVGTWSVSSSWEGQSVLLGASSSLESFTVGSITCSVLASEIPFGSSITVTGTINTALSDIPITLTYTAPNGSAFTRIATTTLGDYTDIHIPTVNGSWTVFATWTGDATHIGASSLPQSFMVKKYGCLIATATYGSELSPNVQFLRGFRDNTVLSTFAGSNFMTVFNEFYYSFSPNIASIIADNSAFRSSMKVILYPLIGILHLSSTTFSLFNFNLELGVILAGLVASVLLGVVYFMPIPLILTLIKKYKIPKKIIHLMGLIWIGSVLMLLIAEVSKSPHIMMISSSVFVLVTISTTVVTSLRILSTRFR
jgi:PKD repeat protein